MDIGFPVDSCFGSVLKNIVPLPLASVVSGENFLVNSNLRSFTDNAPFFSGLSLLRPLVEGQKTTDWADTGVVAHLLVAPVWSRGWIGLSWLQSCCRLDWTAQVVEHRGLGWLPGSSLLMLLKCWPVSALAVKQRLGWPTRTLKLLLKAVGQLVPPLRS